MRLCELRIGGYASGLKKAFRPLLSRRFAAALVRKQVK